MSYEFRHGWNKVDRDLKKNFRKIKFSVDVMPEKVRGMKFDTIIHDEIAGMEFKPGQMIAVRDGRAYACSSPAATAAERDYNRQVREWQMGLQHEPPPSYIQDYQPLPTDFAGFMNHSTLDPSVTSNEGVLTLEKLNEFCALVFGQSYRREKPLPTIDLMNALTKLFLPENTRTLLEAGYVDTNMTLTPKGRDALNAITLASNMEALLVSARESIAEAKANKE